jgi:DNA-binding NarL/FixJ family response regulator
VLSPAATRRLLDTVVGRAAEQDELLDLIATPTERERDVLACLGRGMSNADIARRLRLSP